MKFPVLDSREAGSCGNPALVVLEPRHHDISLHAPVSTPTENEEADVTIFFFRNEK